MPTATRMFAILEHQLAPRVTDDSPDRAKQTGTARRNLHAAL